MTPKDSVLERIRTATAGRHRAIERAVALDEGKGLAGVIPMLQVFEAFLRRWEPDACAVLPLSLRTWFDARRRGSFAAHDLRVLHVAALAADCESRIRLRSPAAALGSMYVVEGSALGGHVIARGLRERHGVGVHNGGSFFAARGADTGRLWHEFCDVLQREVGGQDMRVQAACDAADATFEALTRMFLALGGRDPGHGSARLAA